ncbi:hypothetical protein OKW35_005144 [Paraburkholderia sp. MM5477-R1]
MIYLCDRFGRARPAQRDIWHKKRFRVGRQNVRLELAEDVWKLFSDRQIRAYRSDQSGLVSHGCVSVTFQVQKKPLRAPGASHPHYLYCFGNPKYLHDALQVVGQHL